MQKLLSVCLIIVMMLSVFSVTASAETVVMTGDFDAKVQDLFYSLNDDLSEATVVGYTLDIDYKKIESAGEKHIPETITYGGKKYTVTGIESQAFMQSLYGSFYLPSTIYYIGDGAFMSCDFLEQVVIPEECKFKYFGNLVFSGTPFEGSAKQKDETIFGQNVLYSYNGNADEYVIPDGIDIIVPQAFFMSGVKNVVFNNKITEIPAYAFVSCRNLTSVLIPDNIKHIGDSAFKDCTNLESVILGKNVTGLGVGCFANTKLKTIHLGTSVQNISGAFNDCKTLENITVDTANTLLVKDGDGIYSRTQFANGSGLKPGFILEYYLSSKANGKITLKPDVGAIGDYAFYGCKGLEEVVAKELKFVDVYAFYNSGIKKFSAEGNYAIYDAAFRNCKNLEFINLQNVDYIGIGTFENCTSLKNVTFNKDISEIGELAFANTGLTNVVIYGDDCSINESAFKGCKELESVRLEEGVVYIGMNAFLYCPKLKTIYISKSVISIADNAFNGCDNVTFELIKNSTAYKYIDNKTDFNIEVVGKYSLWQRIIDFFRALFGLD